MQVDPDTRTVATVFDNAASATYQGAELETQFVVNQYLRVFLNYGYLDAEYDEFRTDINASDGISRIDDASFLKPRNAPDYTLGVGFTATIPMGSGDVEIYAKYSEVDEIETNLLNTPLGRVDKTDNATASIGYYAENWSASIFGRNLTDERTETFIPIATLFAAGSLTRPRHIGVEFSYEF